MPSDWLVYAVPIIAVSLMAVSIGGCIYQDRIDQQNGIVDLGFTFHEPVDLRNIQAGDIYQGIVIRQPFVTAEAYGG